MTEQVRIGGNRALNMTKSAFSRLKNFSRPRLLSRIMERRTNEKVRKETIEDFEQAIIYLEDLRDNDQLKDQIDQDEYNRIIDVIKNDQNRYQGIFEEDKLDEELDNEIEEEKLDEEEKQPLDKEEAEKIDEAIKQVIKENSIDDYQIPIDQEAIDKMKKEPSTKTPDEKTWNIDTNNKTSKERKKVKYMDGYNLSVPWWAIDKNGMIKSKYAGTSLDELQKMDLKYKGLVGTFLSIPLIGPATALIGTSLMKINAELWQKSPEFMQNWLHSANVSINNFIGSPYKFLESGEWINSAGTSINNIDSLGDVLKVAASGVITGVSGWGFVKGIKEIKDNICSYFKNRGKEKEKPKDNEKPWNIFETPEVKDKPVDVVPTEPKINNNPVGYEQPIEQEEPVLEIEPVLEEEPVIENNPLPEVIELGPGEYQVDDNQPDITPINPESNLDSNPDVIESDQGQMENEPINNEINPIQQSVNENESEIKHLEDLLQQLEDSKSSLTKEQYEQEKSRINHYLDKEKTKKANLDLVNKTAYELQQLEKLNQHSNTQMNQYTKEQYDQELVARKQIIENNLQQMPIETIMQLTEQFPNADILNNDQRVQAYNTIAQNKAAIERLNQYGEPTDQYSIDARNEELARRTEEIRQSEAILNSNNEVGGRTI